MTEKTVAPYGSWRSPITAASTVAGRVNLVEIQVDGADIYWIEARPQESGRQVVVCQSPDGTRHDVTPPPYNNRSRVHEYGGGAYAVQAGTIYFSHFGDHRIYRLDPGTEPRPITPEADWRYADFAIDVDRDRLICVREDHSRFGAEAVNTLISVPISGEGPQQILAAGNDFYASPRISPDGTRIAWQTWNHPNLPWDGCELWVATIGADGSLVDSARVAGDEGESIFQPQWSPDGTLYFVSDRAGWWNIYRLTNGGIESVTAEQAEFGLPQWAFRMSTFAFVSESLIACLVRQKGVTRLATIDTGTLEMCYLDLPFSELASIRAHAGAAVMVAGSSTRDSCVIRVDVSTGSHVTLKKASRTAIPTVFVSESELIEFPTEGGKTAFALYYPPKNADFAAPDGEIPPLIVHTHGGPTGRAATMLNLGVQFWTSRGFAVVDVDYGGSVGYGRKYRERLEGNWGIMDVDDCVNAAQFLVRRGAVDGNRMIIVGGSAGGYTTLNALTFRDVFQAGASYFGISDLVPFVRDTHKFESRYIDRLIAPFVGNEDVYRARSAVNFADRLSSPMIIFQGLDDRIVPPNQAEIMVEALRRKGLPFAHVAFEGEGHGFRRAENIIRCLEAELYFYSRVFGFTLADTIEPVPIENLR